jgi:hypothetical protein
MFLRTPLLVVTFGTALLATPITFTTPPVTDTGWNACGANPAYSCRTIAYFDSESTYSQGNYSNLVGSFQNEFSSNTSWNSAGWKLDDDGAAFNSLTNGFNVTVATAQQFSGVTLGGLTITIQVTGTLPKLDPGYQYAWLQGLYDNYTLNPFSIVTPFYEMDVNSSGCVTAGTGLGGSRSGDVMCPPAYPYQDQVGNNSFYDQPKASYVVPPTTAQAFFDATAMFGEIDYAAKDVKLYDGVTYGFQNYVSPEPASWLLCSVGVVAIAIVRRGYLRRTRRR